MKYNHFSLLPIHAFQPRPFGGMTLEGGAVDFVEDVVGGAVDAVGDVISGVGDVISDVGSTVDDFVNDAIPGGWGTVAAVTIAATTGIPTDFGATEALAATEAAEYAGLADAFGGSALTGGELVDLAGLADAFGTEAATTAFVPSAFETAVNTALGQTPELGTFGQIGTAGFGTALPAAADVAAGLEAAGFAPGTAANLAGLTSAGIGATNLLGGATALSPLTTTLTPSLSDIVRTANTATKLLNQNQPIASSGTRFAGTSLLNPLGSGVPTAGGLPESLEANVLAAAPVTSTPPSPMNLLQLKQLYPQLSTIDPRLLQMLTNKTSGSPGYYTYGAGADESSATGDRTAFSLNPTGGLPTAGYPSIAADRLTRSRTPGEIPDYMGNGPLTQQGLSMLAGRSTYGFAEGGTTHKPEFITGATGHYVQGRGDGQSDDIPAMLADGEYVFDADTVAALGNGSNKAGAAALDKMRENVRKHKRSASHKEIPPKAKSPLAYMKG